MSRTNRRSNNNINNKMIRNQQSTWKKKQQNKNKYSLTHTRVSFCPYSLISNRVICQLNQAGSIKHLNSHLLTHSCCSLMFGFFHFINIVVVASRALTKLVRSFLQLSRGASMWLFDCYSSFMYTYSSLGPHCSISFRFCFRFFFSSLLF